MMTRNLVEVINDDCKLWEKLNNEGQLLWSYLYLRECADSKENGCYQLILNGHLFWYGTLAEINAIVKSMITRLERKDFLYEN